MAAELIHGCCLQEMAAMAAAGRTFDSIVTDPPAGIAFMGREWDRDRGGRDHWIAWMQQVAAAALLVAKPGAHALVWALPRTSHWTATAWENAGWEVRDRLSHLFGSGFPKSLNVSAAIDKAAGAEREVIGTKFGLPGYSLKQADESDVYGDGLMNGPGKCAITAPATPEAQRWDGFGTALKPAMEDWWLLRKPLSEKTVAANVCKHGTGALNIDSCRVAPDENLNGGAYSGSLRRRAEYSSTDQAEGAVALSRLNRGAGEYEQPAGRWPPNVLHSGDPEVLAAFARFGERAPGRNGSPRKGGFADVGAAHETGRTSVPMYTDKGSAARYFPALGFSDDELRFCYAAKASKAERMGTTHPCTKPLSLMRWLTRLITPPGGTVLDMFSGSGTTGLACAREGFDCVLIERELEYCQMIRQRLGLDFNLEAAD